VSIILFALYTFSTSDHDQPAHDTFDDSCVQKDQTKQNSLGTMKLPDNMVPIAKRYTCEICGESSIHKGFLWRHRLVHTGEKPFACVYCPKRFAKKDNLQHHVITQHPREYEEETREKANPHKCEHCD